MGNEPNFLYAAVEPAPFNSEGVWYKHWLLAKYGEGQFGFITGNSGAVVVIFYDEGHRDDFIANFGGMKGKAIRTSVLGDGNFRPLIGAK